MALGYRTSIWKLLDCPHKLSAMPRGSCIEIKRAGMTQIAFRDQIGKDQNLML